MIERILVGGLVLELLVAASSANAQGGGRRRLLEPRFTAAPTAGVLPLTVHFTNRTRSGWESLSWTFGDGGTSTLTNPSHTYTNPGTYTVTLTARSFDLSRTLTAVDLVTVHEPVGADFVGSPTRGPAPLAVAFTDLSTGAVDAWSWDFGDGGSSSVENPGHVYAVPGLYTVSLTASGPGGTDTRTAVGYVSVTTPPVADFVGTPRVGPVPLSVAFTDLSTGSIASRTWDFGDGSSSSAANPTHEYLAEGRYTVSFSVSGPDGADIETKVDYVEVGEPLASPGFSATPRSGPAPLTVDFTDLTVGNVTAWSWDFGDGATATIANPSHTYTESGAYPVSLTVANASGSVTLARAGYIAAGAEFPGALFGMPTTELWGTLELEHLDDDGILDLVGFGAGSSSIEFMHGDGRGFYTLEASVGVQSIIAIPHAAVIGDFNGDLVPDVVVTEREPLGPLFSERRALLLLADGLGGYVAGTPIDIGDNGGGWCCALAEQALAAADLDRDGALDFVVANEFEDAVSALFGDGTGGFSAPVVLAVGARPIAVELPDLDGDLYPDLVVANETDRSVVRALNAGDGTFGAVTTIASFGGDVLSVQVADLDGDTFVDVVVGASDGVSSVTIAVLGGLGDGSFSVLGSIPTMQAPEAIACGDYDGDLDLDLAFGHSFGGPALGQVLLNEGAGSFAAGDSFKDLFCRRLEIQDVDGDGQADLTGGGGFEARTTLRGPLGSLDTGSINETILGATALSAADLDADGRTDVFGSYAIGFGAGGVHVQWNEGDGGPGTSAQFPTSSFPITNGDGDAMHAADLDADGRMDVVFASGAAIAGLMGNGDRTFEAMTAFSGPGPSHSLALGDLNGDLVPDIISANNTGVGSVFLGLGDGTFVLAGSLPATELRMELGDLDLDGDLDLVRSRDASPTQNFDLGVRLGNGDGTFGGEVSYNGYGTLGSHRMGQDIELADTDGDGLLDAVSLISAFPDAAISVMRNVGGGSLSLLQAANVSSDVSGLSSLLIADIDGDLLPDAMTAAVHGVVLARGLGNGTFEDVELYSLPRNDSNNNIPLTILAVDMDSDADLDLVTSRWDVLTNRR